MKYLYWVGGVFIAIVGTLSLVVSFLDWNEYRDTLADLASKQTGMKVELAGNVSASIFPRPAVSVESVRLSPLLSNYSNTIATADRIDVRLGLMGLFGGDLSIQSLLLDGVTVALEQTQAGGWQVKGWPQTDENAETAEIDLARFELRGGKIDLIPYGQQPYVIEGLSMELDGHLPMGPLSWEGDFFVRGQKIQTSGQMQPVKSTGETALKVAVEAGGASLDVSGRLSNTGDVTGRVQVAGESINQTAQMAYAFMGEQAASLPDLPFKLDMQIESANDISRIVSRALSIGGTNGRADITIAQKAESSHVTGTVSLGVIDFNQWSLAGAPDGANTVSAVNQPVNNTLQPVSAGNVFGAIDVTIEGIRLRSGLGQRIDSVITIDEQGVGVSQLQALLPGATTVSFNGAIGVGGGKGKLQLNVENIPDLTKWLELDLADTVPEGRLTTAALKTDIELSGEKWALKNIQGLIDTMSVTGEIQGSISNPIPSNIKLTADTVNLDAYIPTSQAQKANGAPSATVSLPANTRTVFDIEINRLQWLDTVFSDVAVNGNIIGDQLTFSKAQLLHGKGKVSLADSTIQFKDDMIFAVGANLTNWSLPIVRYYLPDYKQQIRASGFTTVDGTLSLSGPLSTLRIGLDVHSGHNIAKMSGSIGLDDAGILSADLQGNMKHADLAPLLRSFGTIDLHKLPIEVTATVIKKSLKSPFDIKAGGDAAGAKVQLQASYNAELDKAALSFDHPNAGKFLDLTGLSGPGLERDQPIRGEVIYAYIATNATEGERAIKLNGVQNGPVNIDGALNLNAANKLGGKITLSGLDIDKIMAIDRGAAQQPKKDASPALQQLNSYSGDIEVALDRVQIGGQKLLVPNLAISLGNGVLRVDAGKNAKLNGQPLALNLNMDTAGNAPFKGHIQADKFDISAALISEGLGNIITAAGSIDLDISGDITSGMAGLKGGGKLSAQTGTLNFLSVPALVSQMTAAKTSSSFLGSIGTLLRQGTTQANTIDMAFALDSGVMLLETAKAAGAWGNFNLDGQVNFVDRFLSVKGVLALINPADTPSIPVKYEGSFDAPTANWSSRLFERYVLAGIEQRLRGSLFKEMEENNTGEGAANNPGIAVFGRAFDMLNKLKDKQSKEQEAKEKAASQGSGE
ncbi:AsmA family protein [Kordiimonas pumila]|uniref:AsmA family protein n=1 Tax=Kordiimonas pumila TaxID=2161677 RepID=A0ABV7D8T0_9PROT|nr:AsmA family protein [Kordiimonas pumila]